jgi:hypothetical protein
MTTKTVAGLIGAVLALGAALPANANGVAHFDSNLERFAKAQLARKMGQLRDAILPTETPLLVSAEMVERGLVPLNQLPLDHERNAFAAFGITAATGFNFPGRLIVRDETEVTASVVVAHAPELKRAYTGAFITLGN